MNKQRYAEQVRFAEAQLRREQLEPGIKPPRASELGVLPRRFGENPPRPDGSRYRPRAATNSVRPPDPYWSPASSPPGLVYPDE